MPPKTTTTASSKLPTEGLAPHLPKILLHLHDLDAEDRFLAASLLSYLELRILTPHVDSLLLHMRDDDDQDVRQLGHYFGLFIGAT